MDKVKLREAVISPKISQWVEPGIELKFSNIKTKSQQYLLSS